MTARRLQLVLAVVIASTSALELASTYRELPDLMASNFGGDGAPGGWSSKRSVVMLHFGSMAFWLTGILAAPLLASRTRRNLDDVTRHWLGETVGWFALASLALSAVVMHLVVEANIVTGKLSATFGWLIATYLAYVVWWTVRLVRRTKAFSTRAR